MIDLAVIVPSIRGLKAIPSLKAALAQQGFDSVTVIVGGESCGQDSFREACREISPRVLLADPIVGCIRPGQARNIALEILKKKKGSRYILFVDDDILLPSEFALVLKKFLGHNKNVTAVMGRVESTPHNYWTRSIDFSNFWWLQVDKNILDLGWLGAGATMMLYSDLLELRFDEDLIVNEDIDFFLRLSKSHNRTLGICAETTSQHYHARRTFMEFVRYQFYNGKNSKNHFHSKSLSFRSLIIGLRNSLMLFKKTLNVNRRQLIKKFYLLFGVLLSIFIYETGILSGIALAEKKDK